MGSELVPALFRLRATESAQTGKPFLDNIRPFGLLRDPASARRELPVSLTAAVSKDARFPITMVGLNCAACHTGELTYQGRTIRFEAVEPFRRGGVHHRPRPSLVVTVKTPSKLLAFLMEQRPGSARSSSQRAFSGFRRCHAGDLERKLADRIESLVKDEWQRTSAALESGLAFDKDQAKLSEFIGKIEYGNWADLAAEPDPRRPIAHLKTTDDRASALKQVFEHLTTNIRLMKARSTSPSGHRGGCIWRTRTAVPAASMTLGRARNLLFDAKDAQAMDGPYSIPHLWGTPKLLWTNWDGSTRSTLERSVATVFGPAAVALDPEDVSQHRRCPQPRPA